jgi:AcrR family transcriptional regulator
MSLTLDTKDIFVSTTSDVDTTRTYTMRARADQVERTREEILSAAVAETEDRASVTIGLADVAARSGVTVRTILRHFGTREALFDAVMERLREHSVEERVAPVGDLDAAVRTIVAHYEKRGNHVLRLLEEESVNPRVAGQVEVGRRLHREWVKTTFAPLLVEANDEAALVDLLIVATDVYTWKLLRRDFGLSRARTEQRIRSMIRRLAGGGG